MKPETRTMKPETRTMKPETRTMKPETRTMKPETRTMKPETLTQVAQAGMLQAPFIDAAHSDARNYGSIGCILAHEMSHGFDDEGSRFDGHGDLHPW